MVLENALASLSGLSAQEGIVTVYPLIIFTVAMAVYCMVIFKLYRFISTKDIVRISEGTGSSRLHQIAYDVEYIFLFPVMSFLWFFFLSITLSLFASAVEIGNIFLISMATLATIRVTAYYSEQLSQDVAKLIPFGLLAIFLIEFSVKSQAAPAAVLSQIPAYAKTLLYYFVFIVILEFVLRVLSHFSGKKLEEKNLDLRK